MAKKVLYCRKCRKKTVHKYVCGDKPSDDYCFFPLRLMVGVFTFGMSEMEWTKYYECPICHNLVMH